MEVSIDMGGTPFFAGWFRMGEIHGNPDKLDDLGGTPILETPI